MTHLLIMALVPLIFIHIVFIIAVKRRDFSIIDTFWGLGFLLIISTGVILSKFSQTTENLIFFMVMVWGLRLALFLHSRNTKWGEDARYKKMRENWGDKANVAAYFKVYLLQYGLLLIVSLPLFGIHFSPEQDLTGQSYLGVFLWMFGLSWESIGDFQKSRFKKDHPHGLCKIGLWKYSRHPNYFGEATLWYGITLVALTGNFYWIILGPLFLNLLLVKVSGIPLTEKKHQGDLEYDEYKKSTPAMIPSLSKLLKSGDNL